MSTETLDLVLVDAQNAVQIFTGGGMAAILDGIEAKVRAIPLDPSTAPGREEIRSVAYRVAKRDADAAVIREREKVERERKAAEDARLKREADDANREKIRAEILEDLIAYTVEAAITPIEEGLNDWVVDAIMDGKVRHVRVVF
jgi:hypothetical protein